MNIILIDSFRYLSKDTFKKLSYYIIPNKELCGKINVLRLDEKQTYIGFPVEILNFHDRKYERGSYVFNFGMIVSKNTLDDEFNKKQI